MPHTAISPPQSLDPAVAAVRSVAADGTGALSSPVSAVLGPRRGGAVDAVRLARAERGAARAAAARRPRLAGRAGTTVVRSAGGRLVVLPTGRAA
jgi:hypothetical protein